MHEDFDKDFEDQAHQVSIEGQEHEDEGSHQTHEEYIPIEDQAHAKTLIKNLLKIPLKIKSMRRHHLRTPFM